MTRKPYSCLLLLLIALLVFSFRPKENTSFNDALPLMERVADDNTGQPIFPGCEKLNLIEQPDCSHQKLNQYVADHLIYPDGMKAARIEGKVIITFAVADNGLVSDVRITKSFNPSADEAAMEVINSLNENVGKWTPGTKEGIPVTMDVSVPITFSLGIKTEQSAKQIDLEEAPPPPATIINEAGHPYTYVESMPKFADGQEAMYQFIYSNLKYPELAKKNEISGQVIVQFVVSKEGEIKNAKVVRGLGSGCDEEALRLINSMPRWKPGMHNGSPVPVTFTLPIRFVLQ